MIDPWPGGPRGSSFDRPEGKSIAQIRVLLARLKRAAIKRILVRDDEIEHRPIHQNIEYRIVIVLIDQRTGPERLIEAFLDHLDDHQTGIRVVLSAARRRHGSLLPVRLGPARQHDVKQWNELFAVLPHGARGGPSRRNVERLVGRSIERDERQPRIEVEAALKTFEQRTPRSVLAASAHGRPDLRSDFFPSSSRVMNLSASNVLGSVVLQSPNGDSGAGELVIAVACADAGCDQPAHASRPSTPTKCKPRCWRMIMLSRPFLLSAIRLRISCFEKPLPISIASTDPVSATTSGRAAAAFRSQANVSTMTATMGRRQKRCSPLG